MLRSIDMDQHKSKFSVDPRSYRVSVSQDFRGLQYRIASLDGYGPIHIEYKVGIAGSKDDQYLMRQ